MGQEAKEQAQEQNNQSGQAQQDSKPEPKYTQEDIDRVVQDRLAREGVKRQELEELRKFKEEHEKTLEKQTQKDLEAQKKYEEALGLKDSKLKEYENIVSQKETKIRDMMIDNALNYEVMRQNAFPQAKDLIKANAIIDENGEVRIKGKDGNGLDTQLSVEEGVKKYLESNAFLVKATAKPGGGTAAPNAGGEKGQPTDLSEALSEAIRVGDRKKVYELKAQIRAKQGASQTVNVL